MQYLFSTVLAVFLTMVLVKPVLSVPLAHIQAQLSMKGQALGSTLADQQVFLEAWEDGAKIRADLLDAKGIPTRSAIVRKDLGRLYLIEHEDQGYQERPYPPPSGLIDYGQIPVLSVLIRLGLFKNGNVRLQESGGTRLINNYRCTGYKLEVTEGRNTLSAEIWASPQINADKLFGLESAVIVSLAPQAYQRLVRDVLASYTDIEGFPLEADVKASATRLAGGSFSWELLYYDRTKAPLGAYEPPANYLSKR